MRAAGGDADGARAWLGRRALLGAATGLAVPLPAQSQPRPLLGVNLAGAEFGTEFPGRHGSSYIWPGNASADYYLDRGMAVLRLPFRWERLEARPGAGFHPAEIGHLDRLVRHIAGRGGHVILDLHNYGRWREAGRERVIGQRGGPSAAALAGLWSRLATRYLDLPNVIHGLMNEPHDQEMGVLVEVLQTAITAIRATGSTQLILVPGNHWSGGHSWVYSGNAAAMLAITDPGQNFAFDIHQYLDARSSGVTNICEPGSGASRLTPFTDWARANNRRGFLGEFNAGPDELCLTEMAALLDHVQTHADVWLGAAYWAGGPWWGDAIFAVEPADLARPVDRPQMAALAARVRR